MDWFQQTVRDKVHTSGKKPLTTMSPEPFFRRRNVNPDYRYAQRDHPESQYRQKPEDPAYDEKQAQHGTEPIGYAPLDPVPQALNRPPDARAPISFFSFCIPVVHIRFWLPGRLAPPRGFSPDRVERT
jgi:hypothetical protein